jgi:hypothetical protein
MKVRKRLKLLVKGNLSGQSAPQSKRILTKGTENIFDEAS